MVVKPFFFVQLSLPGLFAVPDTFESWQHQVKSGK